MSKITLLTLPLTDIIPYANNPRNNDDAVEAVMESIVQCGYNNPITVDENHVILGGHTRLRALKRLGWKECQVNMISGLTEEQKRKFRILDNKTGENAQWDLEKLLGEVEGLNFDGFDFGLDELLEGFSRVTEELDASLSAFLEPEEPQPASNFEDSFVERFQAKQDRMAESTGGTDFNSAAKELPEIGETVGGIQLPKGVTPEEFLRYAEDYQKEQEEERAERNAQREANKRPDTVCQLGDVWKLGDNVLYCGNASNEQDIRTLIGNTKIDLAIADIPDMQTSESEAGEIRLAQMAFLLMNRVSKNQIVFKGWRFTNFLPKKRGWIVWDKESENGNCDLIWTSFEKPLKIYKWKWNGLVRAGKREVELGANIHPAQKPVGLLEKIITESIGQGHTVMDLFGGSGSTLIACERLQLQCFMMELDEKCCDGIIQRWQDYTGMKAVRIE